MYPLSEKALTESLLIHLHDGRTLFLFTLGVDIHCCRAFL